MSTITSATTDVSSSAVTSAAADTSTGGFGLDTISDSFASLMAFFSSDSDTQADTTSTSGTVTSDSLLSMDDMQSGLLSALGLAGSSTTSGSIGLSDSALSDMQNSLLAGLQSNLFGGASTTEASNETLSQSQGVFGQLTQAKDYLVGEDGLMLDDAFDAANILNHIPLVADVYQQVTSTAVDPISDIVGGYLFGGPLGVGYAAVNLAVEGITGKSIFDNLGDYILDDTQLADADSSSEEAVESATQAKTAYQFVSRTF